MSSRVDAEVFLAMHLAFDEFGHTLWGGKMLSKVMALTLFFWSYAESSQILELVGQVPSVQFDTGTCTRYWDSHCWPFFRLDIAPTDENYLKLSESNPINRIQIDLASLIPKQDDEEEFHLNKILPPGTPTTPQLNEEECQCIAVNSHTARCRIKGWKREKPRNSSATTSASARETLPFMSTSTCSLSAKAHCTARQRTKWVLIWTIKL